MKYMINTVIYYKTVVIRYNIVYHSNMSKNAESTITFNTPVSVKNRLQDMAKANGLTISDLMRMSAQQILNKGIKIEPTYEPSDYLINAIQEGEKDLADGRLTTVGSPEELDDYFKKLKR